MARLIGLICSWLMASSLVASILPENNLYLQDSILSSRVTQIQFNNVIAKFQRIFGPIVEKSHFASLEVVGYWDDDTVAAYADQFSNSWMVEIYGGLARRPELNSDSLSLIICHELGHHLAGFPMADPWASFEGQSDFFATHSCIKKLWEDDSYLNYRASLRVQEIPRDLCMSVYSDFSEQNLCFRTMIASLSLSRLLTAISNPGERVSYGKPDPKIAGSLVDYRPSNQCRLDTFMAGALCSLDFNFKIIPGKQFGYPERLQAPAEMVSAKYVCSKIKNRAIGVRPRCWFKSNFDF